MVNTRDSVWYTVLLPGFVGPLVVRPIPMGQSATKAFGIDPPRLEIGGVEQPTQLLRGVVAQQVFVEDDRTLSDPFYPPDGVISPRKGHVIDGRLPIGSTERFFRCQTDFTARYLPIAISKDDIHRVAQQ